MYHNGPLGKFMNVVITLLLLLHKLQEFIFHIYFLLLKKIFVYIFIKIN